MDILSSMGKNITLRVKNLREKCINTNPEICTERARLITESYKETESLPMPLRRAKAFAKILNEMSIHIFPGELIVGNHASKFRAVPVFPEFDVEYIEEEIDQFALRSGDSFQISEEAKSELKKIFPYWKGKTIKERNLAILPKETVLAGEGHVGVIDSAWVLENGDGHLAPDYPKILHEGLGSILKETRERLSHLNLANPEDFKKRIFYESVIIANKAVIRFAQRFSRLAKELADKEKNLPIKLELQKISNICSKVPEKPATSFHEAMQSLWFVQLAIQLETNGHSISIGRFDQFMYPFYQQDLEEGILTKEEVLELMQCLWIKLSSLAKLRSWSQTRLNAGYPMFQNLVIGGQTPNRQDATNELTYMCLAATATMKLVQPTLTARYHNESPDAYLKACARVIRLGLGMPAMFNDEIIIPAMLNRGVAVKDALNYCIVGCVEPSVQGKWGGRYGACLFNLTKTLELALNKGKDLRTGIQLCPDDKGLLEFSSYEEVFAAYQKQVEYYVTQHVIKDNVQDLVWEEMLPTPFISSLVSDCISRGKELKQGGAIYDYTGGQTGNIANVANSLAAIKKLVFEEKIISKAELKQALDSNFEGKKGEMIRQLLVNKSPKYGNDIDEVDTIAKEAFNVFFNEVGKHKNTRFGRGPIGGGFHPSNASVAVNVPFGFITGATPDGRKAWVPLADVESPFRGTDTNGPTALIRSVGKIDHIWLSGGTILNLKFNPSEMDNESQLDNFIALIRTYFDLQGMEIQFNVVSNDVLRKAQKNPEAYRDLVVRVAGYSANFVALDPEIQNDIIARTAHVLS